MNFPPAGDPATVTGFGLCGPFALERGVVT
jgi:hypothetical protein